jgi:hypothetical protein
VTSISASPLAPPQLAAVQLSCDWTGAEGGPFAFAITGGTGAYRTAHGELQTAGPDAAGNERITLKLIL